MISCSHWGMFEGRRYVGSYHNSPIFECDDLDVLLPDGLVFKDRVWALSEWRRPDGMIEIVRA